MNVCLPSGWMNRLTTVYLLITIIMEQTVQAKIISISTNHANPRWAAGQMKEVLKENVKLVNRRTQTMLLKDLVKKALLCALFHFGPEIVVYLD